jgi:ArsR family transcriptional regulator, arsenate/arsenite/antimonite-responsive transcriptional repressor
MVGYERDVDLSAPAVEWLSFRSVRAKALRRMQYIGNFRCMETDAALVALAALAHRTRLDAFRLLVRHEPDGLSTGELVAASGLSQSTLSTHLSVLIEAGLVATERRGRQMIQRASLEQLQRLMLFLARDCCQGRPELCASLAAELACC